jgi:hypothetical protein
MWVGGWVTFVPLVLYFDISWESHQ